METGNILKVYDEVKSDFKFITSSGVRKKIILSLNESPQSVDDLKNRLNIKSSSILREIKLLKNHNIVFNENKHYTLSPQGRIISLKYESMINTLLTIKNNKIWLNHDISSIPSKFLRKIDCLSDSFIIESTLTNIINPNTRYKKMIADVSEIRALSPIYDYSYVELYLKCLQNNAAIDLLVTSPVLEKINEICKRKEILDVISSFKKLEIWKTDEELKIAFTVTEKFFSMGLFLEGGTYDPTINLVSKNEKAIGWGTRLFEHYLKTAEKII